MNEGICDFRFAICDSRATQGRNSRGGHYRGKFVGLLIQSGDALRFQQSGVNYQFKPVGRFVGFLFHSSQLRDEFGLRTPSARGSVVCANRRTASDQLTADSPSLDRPRQSCDEFQHTQGKFLRSFFQFSFLHSLRLTGIRTNRKSQI
jgi:hypothetical protein